MANITELNPQIVWKYFHEITQIPRPSKKEEKIIEYLLDFGKTHNLETNKDDVGNIVIKKDATPGKEQIKTIVLQGHMDMVCEKNSGVEFNFDTDPINTYIDEDWVKADGTTLGADNGIGIAYQLAILASDNIPHGPIECLITADEETGMTGAKGIKPGFINGKTFINIDTEEDDEICIGCAGGLDTIVNISYKKEEVSAGSIGFKISVTGLKGGHSADIDNSAGNANKIVTRILWNIAKKIDIKLAHFDGGNLRNAIPREAFANIVLKSVNKESLLNEFNQISEQIQKEIIKSESGIIIQLKEMTESPLYVIDDKSFSQLTNSLYAAPNGIIAYSTEMEGLTETSTNLASVKFVDGDKITICFLSRSAIESAKYNVANTIESTFAMIGADILHKGAYPGWAPNANSEILNIAKNIYKEIFNEEVQITATHGGLECGLILKKYPELDLISFGPTIRGAHSPDERASIKSVKKTWDFLLKVLDNIPAK